MTEMDAIFDDADQAASPPGGKKRKHSMRIKTRLWAGFGFVAVCMLAWNLAAIFLAQPAIGPATAITETPASGDPSPLQGLRLSSERLANHLGNYLLTNNPDAKSLFNREMETMKHDLASLKAKGMANIGPLSKRITTLRKLSRQLIALHEAPLDNYPAREFINNNIRADNTALEEKFRQLIDSEKRRDPIDSTLLALTYDLSNRWLQTLSSLYRFTSDREPASLEALKQDAQQVTQSLDALKTHGNALTPAQNSLLDAITREKNTIIANILDLATLQLSDKWRTDSYLYAHKITPLLEDIRDTLANMTLPQREMPLTPVSAQASVEQINPYLRLALVLAALGAMAGLTWLLSRSVLTGIDQARGLAQNIAAGKLDNHISITTNDEVGQLLQAMQTMQEKLKHEIDARKRELQRLSHITHALDQASLSLGRITASAM